VEVTAGFYTPTGPRCMIRMLDGLRVGRCLDGDSLDLQPGGPVHVFPCVKRWQQFLSFGNGKEVPIMALHTTVPLHTRRRIAETGREQEPYMCLGVAGRGDLDEEDWLGTRGEYETSYGQEEESASEDEDADLVDEIDQDRFSVEEDEVESEQGKEEDGGLPPLRLWEEEQLVATRCSNTGAIIEWVVVPFIVEEFDLTEANVNNETAQDEEEEL
jgi:hypothetical protein